MENQLSPQQREELLSALNARFEKNSQRHPAMAWAKVLAKLEAAPQKLWSLHEMERTGGEPDVVGHNSQIDEYLFVDCSSETPKGRRSVCYDQQALASRKENKPATSAIEMAARMGIDLLSEEKYRDLQKGERSIRKHRAGSKRRPISGHLVAHSLRIAATAMFLCITTELILTMAAGRSGVLYGFK